MQNPALKRALAEALKLVDEADVVAIKKRRGGGDMAPHEEPDADDYGGPSDNDADNCPDCKAGTCENPAHMKPEEAEGMAALLER